MSERRGGHGFQWRKRRHWRFGGGNAEIATRGEYDEEDSAGEPSAALVWLGALLHYASAVRASVRRRLEERRAARGQSHERKVEASPPPFEERHEPCLIGRTRATAPFGIRRNKVRVRQLVSFCRRRAGTDAFRPSAPPVQPSAPPAQKAKTSARARARIYAPPSLELLSEAKKLPGAAKLSPQAFSVNAQELEGVLEDFAVRGAIVMCGPGPL